MERREVEDKRRSSEFLRLPTPQPRVEHMERQREKHLEFYRKARQSMSIPPPPMPRDKEVKDKDQQDKSKAVRAWRNSMLAETSMIGMERSARGPPGDLPKPTSRASRSLSRARPVSLISPEQLLDYYSGKSSSSHITSTSSALPRNQSAPRMPARRHTNQETIQQARKSIPRAHSHDHIPRTERQARPVSMHASIEHVTPVSFHPQEHRHRLPNPYHLSPPLPYLPSTPYMMQFPVERPAKVARLDNAWTFPVYPLERFQGPCAPYKQPVEVASFSIDGERRFHYDNRELRYYEPAELEHADLSRGFVTFVDRDHEQLEYLDALTSALSASKRATGRDLTIEKGEAVDFVTWRGIMTKFLVTPFTENEAWELAATRYKGSIYVAEMLSERHKQQAQPSKRQELMTFWGYKFESLSTISIPPSQIKSAEQRQALMDERQKEIVNCNAQYGSIVKTKLGQHRILIGAEVDCCADEKPKDNPCSQYIELKTSRVIKSSRDEYFFEKRKLLKFWAQSFLAGVPRIVCGFRDDDGFVQLLQDFKTLEIPRMVRGKKNMWDATICMNFANALMVWLKKHITIDDPDTLYHISWGPPYQEIKLTCGGHKEATFLTDAYLNRVGKEGATGRTGTLIVE